jgi:hypothetical protein
MSTPEAMTSDDRGLDDRLATTIGARPVGDHHVAGVTVYRVLARDTD